jgi:hypothetical protein
MTATSHAKYAGKNYDEVESKLESGWQSAKGTSKMGWSDAKNALRDAWYRVERNQLNSFGGEGVNTVDRAWNYRGSPICTSPWNSSIAPK